LGKEEQKGFFYFLLCGFGFGLTVFSGFGVLALSFKN